MNYKGGFLRYNVANKMSKHIIARVERVERVDRKSCKMVSGYNVRIKRWNESMSLNVLSFSDT